MNYLIIEYIPERGEELCAGSEAFDSYAEALNWLVEYNNLLTNDYLVEPIVNGHFFYRPEQPEADRRAVWIEAT